MDGLLEVLSDSSERPLSERRLSSNWLSVSSVSGPGGSFLPPDTPFRVSPDSTEFTLFSNAYRLVFVLDVAVSMASVDADERSRIHMSVAFERYFLCPLLKSLVEAVEVSVNASMDS